MGLLLSYDIPRKHHRQLRYIMAQLGYTHQLPIGDKGQYHTTYLQLPTGTLYHQGTDTKTAIAELEKVCAFMGLTLTRAIATRLEAYTTVYTH